MKWISNQYVQDWVEQHRDKLPKDFHGSTYTSLHPDLILAGIDTEQKAIEHYLLFGIRENRAYKEISLPLYKETNNIIPEFWNNGKNLLYFSPNAPDFDASSGGNRLLEILKIIKKDLDYNIWFMCNGSLHPKYIQAVKNLDIPVFMPDINNKIYLDKYLNEAKNKNIKFDNVIFSWYDIANQYIEIVKQYYPNIKTIIDSVDVHWIREQRGKDNNQLNISQSILDFRKNLEKQIYASSNVVFAITEKDKQYIVDEIGHGHNIKILSNIHHQYDIKPGNHISFIGNYSHGPNIDAAIRCIDIFTTFTQTQKYKKLKIKPELLIVGPGLDISIQQRINRLNNIKYLGQIKDLKTLYSQTAILLAPLSWGAGIKGKICDIGMCGIPVLTSNIGNEGIDLIHRSSGLVAETNEEFVAELEYFFGLKKKSRQDMGQCCQQHLNRIVSYKAAKNIIKHTLQDKQIVISIVTYNQPIRLNKCLETILKNTKYNNYHIVITNNGKKEDYIDIINKYQKLYPNKITYIQNKINKFFIVPNNKIIHDPKYKDADILLLNDDIEIIDHYWLNHLYSSAYNADYIASAGGKTLYPDGKIAEAGAELYNNGTGLNKGRHHYDDDPAYNKKYYTGYCSGCLLYMRRDALETIGPLSTELDCMYYEDSEWQYRAHFHGLRTIYDYRCKAIHNEGSTSGTDITKGTKKYQEINRKKFLQIVHGLKVTNIEDYN